MSDAIARLLERHRLGDAAALNQLMTLVYDELRRVASRQLMLVGRTLTVSTTVLVHEAYERLAGHAQLPLQDQHHFFALCARVMRQIVIDHLRERGASKRGSGLIAVPLEDVEPAELEDASFIAGLVQALEQLADRDPALAQIADLAWFAGLETEAIARLTGRHVRQVQRDLARARAWVGAALAP